MKLNVNSEETVSISNEQHVTLEEEAFFYSKEVIFILMDHAVSKVAWLHSGIPAKTKASASGVPDAILTLHRELPAHWLSHTTYTQKYKIHAISFPIAFASCWHD